MTNKQLQFLEMIANRIPILFSAMAEGNEKAEWIVGTKIVDGRVVRLKLVTVVVDRDKQFEIDRHQKL